MWHARFAYLEVAVVGEGGGDLSSSSLGNDLGGGSPVYLRRQGKHQWELQSPVILLGQLARRGRQLRQWLGFELSLDGENRSGRLLV
jgi:hypothetical protein